MLEIYTDMQLSIIQSAIHVISTKGYHRLTMKKLAAELNITDAALYKHFKNKERIIRGIVDYVTYQTSIIIGSIEKKKNPAIEKLEELFIGGCVRTSKDSEHAFYSGSYFFFYYEDESIREQLQELEDIYRTSIISVIDQAKKENSIREKLDSSMLYFSIIGSLNYLLENWFKSGGKSDVVAEARDFWNSFKEMIKPE